MSKLKESINNLKESLKKDEYYYFTWQSNIAMAIHDETEALTLDECNNCAKRFLDNFIKYD